MIRGSREWPSDRHLYEQALRNPHFLILPSAQEPSYFGWLEPGRSIAHALDTHLHGRFNTRGIGRLRVFFLADPVALSPNLLADRVLSALGHRRRGWHGPVIVTMEENEPGQIPALTNVVLATLEELTHNWPNWSYH